MKLTVQIYRKLWRLTLFFIIFLTFQIKCEQYQYYGSLPSFHSSLVVSVVIAPDQSFIVTGASQNTLKIWDYNSLTQIGSHTYADIVTNVNIHSTDKKIFVSIFNGVVSILDGTTFSQTTSYTYPNTGNANSIVFPKYQNFYYTGGYDGTAPQIHKFDISTHVQSGLGVSTSFISGNQIQVIDVYDDSSTHGFLTITSNQNTSPFRMIVYNIGTSATSNFDEATSDLTYTKFSPSGQYIFTSSADNKLRMYKYNSNTLTYQYKYFYSTTLYGSPFAITAQSNQFINVAVGRYIIMLEIVDDKLKFIDSIHIGSSDIFSLYQLNGLIVAGQNNGNVKLIKVSYPESDRSWSIKIIIIVGVVVFFVIAVISIIFVIYCIKKSNKVQAQVNEYNAEIEQNNQFQVKQNDSIFEQNINKKHDKKEEIQINNQYYNNYQTNQISCQASQIRIA